MKSDKILWYPKLFVTTAKKKETVLTQSPLLFDFKLMISELAGTGTRMRGCVLGSFFTGISSRTLLETITTVTTATTLTVRTLASSRSLFLYETFRLLHAITHREVVTALAVDLKELT